MVNVLTTEFTLTSQIFEVLSPEAESKWVLSGLQLIYSNKWWSQVRAFHRRGEETQTPELCPQPLCLSRDDSLGGGGTLRAKTGRASQPQASVGHRTLSRVTLTVSASAPTPDPSSQASNFNPHMDDDKRRQAPP